MAETNSPTVVDDSKPVTEDDLRALKYPEEEVETPLTGEDETLDGEEAEKEPEETPEEAEQIPESEEEAAPAEVSFVKEFDYIKGDTPAEYAKNLEAAYKNSSSEAIRLKSELDATKQAPPVTPDAPTGEEPSLSFTDLYVQQKLEEEIQSAFAVTQKEYPQVNEAAEYTKFTDEVRVFSEAAIAKGRPLPPAELYKKAAISLGWEKQGEPDSKDKLGMALKDAAATSKPTSAPTKPAAPAPKISEAQMKLNRQMYPGKTDQEIIDELTPYI